MATANPPHLTYKGHFQVLAPMCPIGLQQWSEQPSDSLRVLTPGLATPNIALRGRLAPQSHFMGRRHHSYTSLVRRHAKGVCSLVNVQRFTHQTLFSQPYHIRDSSFPQVALASGLTLSLDHCPVVAVVRHA